MLIDYPAPGLVTIEVILGDQQTKLTINKLQ